MKWQHTKYKINQPLVYLVMTKQNNLRLVFFLLLLLLHIFRHLFLLFIVLLLWRSLASAEIEVILLLPLLLSRRRLQHFMHFIYNIFFAFKAIPYFSVESFSLVRSESMNTHYVPGYAFTARPADLCWIYLLYAREQTIHIASSSKTVAFKSQSQAKQNQHDHIST